VLSQLQRRGGAAQDLSFVLKPTSNRFTFLHAAPRPGPTSTRLSFLTFGRHNSNTIVVVDILLDWLAAIKYCYSKLRDLASVIINGILL
jgi:hypothetical protein